MFISWDRNNRVAVVDLRGVANGLDLNPPVKMGSDKYG
jgi:hypothetical protein